jgi:uncharacterized protein
MTAGIAKRKSPKCPICKGEAAAPYLPFCSKRCADIDLGKWFTNAYAIPGAVADDEAESAISPVKDDEDEGH